MGGEAPSLSLSLSLSSSPTPGKTSTTPCRNINNNSAAADDGNRRPTVSALLSPIPVLLYRKKLESSDVKPDQNRLLVTRRENLMGFLTEAEAAAVDGPGKGLKLVGMDEKGNMYAAVGVTRWMTGTVINSDWGKVVVENGAAAGDVVEIWGWREGGKPFMEFKFSSA